MNQTQQMIKILNEDLAKHEKQLKDLHRELEETYNEIFLIKGHLGNLLNQ